MPALQALETKIPPPIVTVLVGALMWGVARLTPFATLPVVIPDVIPWAVALGGLALEGAAAWQFYRARTTVDPIHPDKISRLVTTGLYALSRNPIYVGDLLLLIAWSLYLGNVVAFACAWLFVPYIDRFQIDPEERVMARCFGADYDTYRARVRRWL